jgi:hypothetical protein
LRTRYDILYQPPDSRRPIFPPGVHSAVRVRKIPPPRFILARRALQTARSFRIFLPHRLFRSFHFTVCPPPSSVFLLFDPFFKKILFF